ncbi:MAG TPA: 5-oxoprolinase subunit PxpB [Chitinophagaceae bacterium]|nr:5-oxoprolinase subunit PxpB [Chitinophagaceae bacterium]
MAEKHPYSIYSLGDRALTIDFGNRIDLAIHEEVMARYLDWTSNPIPGALELVPAYSSITVFYQVPAPVKISEGQTVFEWIKANIEDRMKQEAGHFRKEKQGHRIPVCYDPVLVPELIQHARTCGISPEELIALHTAKIYTVYMLGFLPGFPYMGEVNEKIALPRKASPVQVPAGAVGIAGKQTGIYPFHSQGGWCLIGQTPIQMFDANSDDPTFLKAGDQVTFFPISLSEYRAWKEDADK